MRHPALRHRALRIGVLPALVAALVAAGFAVLPGTGTAPRTIIAQFDNAIGLYQGNAVAVLGMPVGTVENITAKGEYVEIELRIDSGVRLPDSVQAVTVGTSILTERHIELTPPYTDGPTLPDGAVLGLTRTRTPIEFDRILNMVDKLGTALGGDGRGGGPVAEILDSTAAMAAGSGAQLRSALGTLSEALRTGADDGEGTRQAITTIVTELAALTDAAARNQQLLDQFGSGVGQLSDLLVREQLGQGETGRLLNEVLARITALLTEHRDDLRATVASSDSFARALVDYRRELAEVFNLAPLAVDNVVNAIDQRNGYLRVGAHFDSVFFDSSMTKEVCNILGLRQLGCSTGNFSDMGPDFGVTSVLEAMTRMHP
ncbi:MCE family protein [Nocardia otitidiscaviarum]|uniref:MCE family protein n=1 Tax=Nocardia otitidiscaviarum TaxID=1823 RepID=UPI0004A6E22B|nr:MCE family protein [Nocardia otitidiscaviarum]MBF6135633.1 MCE family protein [Nocardia otitidiscaviarum]MBF6487451.1 MCE family protein [Nocardia otitidiscaviarum]